MEQARKAPDDGRKQHGSSRVKGSEVFVGGLPLSVTESVIREAFSTCGEIVEVRMILTSSGQSKGYCFVRFRSREDALIAIKEKNGSKLQGKKIGVLPSTEQDSLYLGNLCKGWTFEEFDKLIRQAFSDVVSVNLSKPIDSGTSPSSKQKHNRGFAFVQFASHAAAARAFRLGSKPDFLLGRQHPVVEWFEDDSNIDPEELAKIKVAFVGNLPANATEEYLKNLFEKFGKVEKVALSKKSYPVGFVHFSKRSELDKAIEELDGKTVEGPQKGSKFTMQVSVAKPMNKERKRTRDNSESEPAKVGLYGNQANLTRDVNLLDISEYHLSKVSRRDDLLEAPHIDPYEDAVIALPSAVSDRLLRLFRLGVATRYDIDVHAIHSLKELPESAAIAVLDQFMLSCSDEYDKRRLLAAIISRYQLRYANSAQEHLQTADRTRDYYAAKEATRQNLLAPANASAYDNSLLRSSFTTARYNSLSPSPTTFHHTQSSMVMDERLIRTDPRKIDDPVIISSYCDAYSSGAPSKSLGMSSRLAEVPERDSLPQRPQMKFDPYTGQPYKFDPFTGEPIQHVPPHHLYQ